MGKTTNRFVINVVTRDHVGIIATVSDTLYNLGGNLEAVSQTVVWGWFTMIVCGEFPSTVSAEDIKTAVESAGDFKATVFPTDREAETLTLEGEPFIVTIRGTDQPGIVRKFSHCFAAANINIDDVWFEVQKEQFIVIFHVIVPLGADTREVRQELESAAEDMGVEIMLRHQDIFVATNSLSVHTRPE